MKILSLPRFKLFSRSLIQPIYIKLTEVQHTCENLKVTIKTQTRGHFKFLPLDVGGNVGRVCGGGSVN